MHDLSTVILFIGGLVFLAHAFVAVFERTRVPDVLWLIVIGVAIGPAFHVVGPEDFGKVGSVFTTIALVIILFEGGLEISIQALRDAWRATLLVTMLTYLLTWALLTSVMVILLPFSLLESLYVGAVLAGPAPSVVIPLARQMRISDSGRTTLLLESPIGEALCVVIALALVQAFSIGETSIGHVLGQLIASFVFAIALGVASGFVWSLALDRVRQLRNAIFLTPSAVFIVYGVTEFFGYSGPIAALAFGIVVGNVATLELPWLHERTKLRPMAHSETEKLFFSEAVFLVKTFFFVYLGIAIQFNDVMMFLIGVLLVAGLLAARTAGIMVARRIIGGPQDDMRSMSVLVPKGTAAAVLAGVPLQLGIVNGQSMQDLVYGVVFVSIVVTAVLVYLIERTPSGDMVDRL